MKDKKDLGYEEHLNQTQKEPSEDEVNAMEKVFCKAIVLKNYQRPLNNIDYKSLPYGA